MFGFGKKKSPSVEFYKASLDLGVALGEPAKEKIMVFEEPAAKPAEEWIWVNGYKATDKDMSCRGYQYEMNKCFDISDDKAVEICEHGFHFCLNIRDVQKYYEIGRGHRFFEVKALVRRKDYDEYGNHIGRFGPRLDKLAAKSIIFTRELTLDEIFKGYVLEDWWTDEHKKRALEIGVKATRQEIQRDRLVQLGYSETFAALCIAAERDQIAELVASQEGLSMDMKVWTIFNATALKRQ